MESSLSSHFMAGACAGMAVDVILFPLDTLKTRLQSKEGWRANGHLKRLYSGLSSTILGSAPSGTSLSCHVMSVFIFLFLPAALFFFSYEGLKNIAKLWSLQDNTVVLAASSSVSEILACSVRVPAEVLKQRMQIGMYGNASVLSLAGEIVRTDGFFGLYRGFAVTLLREIPFAAIQFPIYEALKRQALKSNERRLKLKLAACGSIAGGLTAFITTPLDVLKTRIMLTTSSSVQQYSAVLQLRNLWLEGRWRRVFSGAAPRVLWISLGGFIFFGAYEQVVSILHSNKSKSVYR